MSDQSDMIFLTAALSLGLVVGAAFFFSALEYARMRREARITRLKHGGRKHSGSRPDGKWIFSRAFGDSLMRIARATSERLNIMSGGEAERSTELLHSAGFQERETVVLYAFVKTVAPIFGGALGLAWFALSAEGQTPIYIKAVVVLGVALALSKAPDAVLRFLRSRRIEAIRKAFPDMLELLVVTSEAGLGPQPAMRRVSSELMGLHPELSREISQMVAEMRLTNDNKRAYNNLWARLPLPEVAIFVQTLEQSDSYGTPFATAMRTLIREQRADRLVRAEERAARLPVLMTIPLITFIMPAVFIVLVGPAALSIIDNIINGMG